MAAVRTAFDPAVHGFGFPNAFVDLLTSLPTGTAIQTKGRCGGMAFASLDYFSADRPAPRWATNLYGAARVPPDGNWLADRIRKRLFDSFRARSALKFVTWAVAPDDRFGPVDGVRSWTLDELAKVVAAVDAGRPVPLGLVVARSVKDVGQDHQVVAHGYERVGDETHVLVTDSNSPGHEVTLQPEAGAWRASNGPLWRGFFVQDYTAVRPVILTRTPARGDEPVGPGSTIALSHVWTGFSLHGEHDLVTGVRRGTRASERWAVEPGSDAGTVTLRNVADGWYLASQAGTRSPTTGQQAVWLRAEPDDWRVEVDGGGAWTAGSRVRIVHAATGVALHSHPHVVDGTGGQREVTGFTGRDDNDWWTVLELS
ncbi:hypothetical protein [Cellulomonas sp. HZM]|uniref:hypothetical protein n=1 Tax=Cellulomonas sp. HZM TaxID=1454010 RepID=UPI0004937D43|nr:hypothetical protein [Cellulomonas sp. HZM]